MKGMQMRQFKYYFRLKYFQLKTLQICLIFWYLVLAHFLLNSFEYSANQIIDAHQSYYFC